MKKNKLMAVLTTTVFLATIFVPLTVSAEETQEALDAEIAAVQQEEQELEENTVDETISEESQEEEPSTDTVSDDTVPEEPEEATILSSDEKTTEKVEEEPQQTSDELAEEEPETTEEDENEETEQYDEQGRLMVPDHLIDENGVVTGWNITLDGVGINATQVKEFKNCNINLVGASTNSGSVFYFHQLKITKSVIKIERAKTTPIVMKNGDKLVVDSTEMSIIDSVKYGLTAEKNAEIHLLNLTMFSSFNNNLDGAKDGINGGKWIVNKSFLNSDATLFSLAMDDATLWTNDLHVVSSLIVNNSWLRALNAIKAPVTLDQDCKVSFSNASSIEIESIGPDTLPKGMIAASTDCKIWIYNYPNIELFSENVRNQIRFDLNTYTGDLPELIQKAKEYQEKYKLYPEELLDALKTAIDNAEELYVLPEEMYHLLTTLDEVNTCRADLIAAMKAIDEHDTSTGMCIIDATDTNKKDANIAVTDTSPKTGDNGLLPVSLLLCASGSLLLFLKKRIISSK